MNRIQSEPKKSGVKMLDVDSMVWVGGNDDSEWIESWCKWLH